MLTMNLWVHKAFLYSKGLWHENTNEGMVLSTQRYVLSSAFVQALYCVVIKMSKISILVPPDDSVKRSPKITPVIASACTIACFITIVSATNRIQVEYPQQSLLDVYTISTEFSEKRMYNSGNINLYLDGVNAMNEDLLRSYQKISEIRCLPDNWNGNGASRFSIELLDSIRDIVDKAVHQPKIFPTARDSIQLEYENNIGDYLEFEIFEGGRFKEFFCGHGGEIRTENISKEMIYEVVNKFYGFEI